MAVPHNGGVSAEIPPGDATVDDLTVEGTLSVTGAVTLTAGLSAASVTIADSAADFTADNVEDALAELQADAETDSAALTAHTGDASAAHAASAISILDTAGDFTATDVEAALAELQSADELDEAALAAHLADTADAHDASAISILDTAGDFAATTVEDALAELQSDHETDSAALTAHISDASAAHAASAISLLDSGGNLTATDVEAALAEVAARGTAFPGSPATNDRFYRTDRGLLYFYNGSAWVTVTLYRADVAPTFQTAQTVNGNSGGISLPYGGTYSILTVLAEYSALPAATNDGSNYWTIKFQCLDSAAGLVTDLGSVTTAADTAGAIVNKTSALSTTLTSTTRVIRLRMEKTGAPGNLQASGALWYRIVG